MGPVGGASGGGLAGRPGEGAPSEDMEMEVEDGLAAVLSDIGDHSVSGLFEPFGPSDVSCDPHQVAEEAGVGGGREALGGFLRDHKYVDGSLRCDVSKRERAFVLIHDVRRDFTFDDLGEEGHVFPDVGGGGVASDERSQRFQSASMMLRRVGCVMCGSAEHRNSRMSCPS